MPFVARDPDGQIVALSEVPLEDDAEHMGADHPELIAFVARTCPELMEAGGGAFVSSDLAFIRVMEDLVEVLIRKGVLALSDLPAPAQDKLMERRALRGWLAGVVGIVDENEGKVI
ncbi:MAG: hypothetical protein H7Y60_09000 [Rhodospirillaceae bacterium]|nr:hypothetical protein [Rhodospirillales bacterium]